MWLNGQDKILEGLFSGSVQFNSVAQSCLTLQPHESQHARTPCASQTPGVHSDSCPSSQWCHPAISSSVFPLPEIPPSIRVFSNESALRMKWPKCWSFSISPLQWIIKVYFLYWLVWSPCSPRDSPESSPALVQKHQFFSHLYGSPLTSICDYWENHSFDYMDPCWQSDISAFEYAV